MSKAITDGTGTSMSQCHLPALVVVQGPVANHISDPRRAVSGVALSPLTSRASHVALAVALGAQASAGLGVPTSGRSWDGTWRSRDPRVVLSRRHPGIGGTENGARLPACADMFCCPLRPWAEVSSHCVAQEARPRIVSSILFREVALPEATHRCSREGQGWRKRQGPPARSVQE